MRIGIVNDSATATEALRRVIVASTDHTVAWLAANGIEAVQRCADDRPDVILMDLIMPEMDGVAATRRIMAETPCAIIVVTASVAETSGRVFAALGAGALDAVNTPQLAGGNEAAGAQALRTKLEMIGRLIGAIPLQSSAVPATKERRVSSGRGGQWLLAIGASAGGPAALAEVLSGFGKATAAAIVVVQHLDEQFAPGLAQWLGQQIALPVRLAVDGDIPVAGTVLLPSRADHLVFSERGTLHYTPEPTDYAYRPSVDALFESVALHWRRPAAGVLLTGMGRDGARGLKKMRDAGFPTIAQDRATSAVYGMPKAAAELGAAEQILPLARIGPALRHLLV
ncbi:chemotaxis-specific protein-glutamate methyltransferase CheB [Horticoccus luteus]|uniref:Protein-glutamate methylesterase/protein-glutamine glutaminase n=1 Tax=Horticoccus luteus TaxID=2862869 RepID=A0A8F9TWC1_9BACT|nr:chemotaxis-specific protein-glutamate methyltransferase CheB [Horticoccus luteus]QYM80444.1 chemotaxis-specific protein-glutamate methyltransferase CheB [Horticoccus luteus]